MSCAGWVAINKLIIAKKMFLYRINVNLFPKKKQFLKKHILKHYFQEKNTIQQRALLKKVYDILKIQIS